MQLEDNNGFIKLNKTQKKMLYLGAFLFVMIVVPVLALGYYNVAISRPAQSFKETTFQIEEGESVSSVSKRLGQLEIVNSEFLFKFYLIVNKLQSKIQAGTYTIPAGTSVESLAKIFQLGTNDVKITYLEGWRLEEFSRHSAKYLNNFDYVTFNKIAKPYEGMLFPDTYYFNVDTKEQDVLDKLLETFERKTAKIFASNEFKNLNLTKNEVLIFASIVEREVRDEKDRRLVAGILLNRYRNGEMLGADATVQYTMALRNFCKNQENIEDCPSKSQVAQIDWWPYQITKDDLLLDDPYNTRLKVGLPPKPIANPSVSSIEAVITYIPTTYNYYLTAENGITYYANTLEEHNLNISKYLN